MTASATPPPRDSEEFSWFERDRVVVVVEGEVLASSWETWPREESLVPPRSDC